jgi:glycosyltransferase involved in cell wall biosynthesis/predicted Zn-dependent protease
MLRKSLTLLDRLGVRPPPAAPPDPRAPARDDAALVRAAAAAQAERDWEKAHELWAAASERRPEDINCWLQLGNMRNELGRHEAAIAAFETAARLDPSAAEPLVGVAGVHERAAAWDAALAAWNAVARLLQEPGRAARDSDPERLAHACLHAAISASMAGKPELARELMLDGTRRIPGFSDQPGHLLLRAQMIRGAAPARALALLRQCLEQTPDDDAARYEFASISLDHGDPAEAAEILAAAVARRPRDISFLWLLADLRDRLRDGSAVRLLAERMAELDPADPRHRQRGLDAALAMRDLVAARRLARAITRAQPAEYMALHQLAVAYEAAEEFDRARLLFRFLRRKWPHSHWHAAKVVILTAQRWSLPEADRLLRSEIAARGRGIDLDRAYYDAAFRSGNHTETRRRLEWFIAAHPDDESARLFLGYVIANTTGIADAERHFAELATNSFQGRGALIGLAHMAMRRRDAHVVHERWANVVGLYPDDTIGRVEYARSAYEIREVGLALDICERQLRRLPSDVTMGEFHAWLLTATGRFEAAWAYLATLRRHAGATWTVLELSLQNAAATGRLAAEFAAIQQYVPDGGTRADGRRLYHALRQLASARRLDLLPALVRRAAVDPRHLAWLAPYLRAPQPSPRADADAMVDPELRGRVEAEWRRVRALVRGDTAERVVAATDAEITALLDQPRSAFPTIHIVNKFEQTRGGSELHALDLAERLSRHAKVELWAPEMPHPHFSNALGVTAIEPGQGHVPHGGVLVMIGVYFGIASWIRRARPRRVIFLYNTFEAPLLFERIQEVHEQTGIRSELVFCSDMMRREVDLPGMFEPSPVDIEMFRPRAAPRPPAHRFTLGRHSRDVIEKHNAEDWRVYAAVAEAGGQTRLLGGTCMTEVFPRLDHIEYLPPRSDRIVEFLHGLDCFYYHTSTWVEPWGRVVIEAMACGLPVLVGDVGGYAEVIEHGQNGLVFRDAAEAAKLARDLAGDPELCRRLGEAARRTVEALLGEPALARLVSFYLAPG